MSISFLSTQQQQQQHLSAGRAKPKLVPFKRSVIAAPFVAPKSSPPKSWSKPTPISAPLVEQNKANATAWKPSKVQDQYPTLETTMTQDDKDCDVNATACAILNKISKDNFTRLAPQFVDLVCNAASKQIVASLVDRLLDQAVQQPFFSSLYAQLANSTLTALSKNKQVAFKKMLLAASGARYYRAWAGDNAENDFSSMLPRDALALFKFIGNLFIEGLLPTKRLQSIFSDLSSHLPTDPTAEERIGCLCMLVETVGATLYQSRNRTLLTDTIAKLVTIRDLPGLSSRTKFRVQDILDLDGDRWAHRSRLDYMRNAATPGKQMRR